MQPSALIADANVKVLHSIGTSLRETGFTVFSAHAGQDALSAARRLLPSVAILDASLPGLDGFEVCRQLKRDPRIRHIQVLILAGVGRDDERTRALEAEAEDSLSKPFSVREAVLRVQALLRRVPVAPAPHADIGLGRIRIDRMGHYVVVEGQELELTRTEFQLLCELATNQQRVLSREDLMRSIWGPAADVDRRNIDTHIAKLRAKLGPAASQLATVRKFGYRLVEAEIPSDD
jgi:DNA-binding response OmpR family regulator